ncbi:hypothetical protein WR25_17074 isoform J [Diploscapter pachys]|nr:hypothetical protein WR25_17074 isoform J [Diploscapter pachys]
MRMIMNDPKDSQLKTIDGLISTLQCLKDNVSGVSSERSSSTASLQKQQIDVTATASSSTPNTAISAASETGSGSGSRDAQTTQTQQQVAFAFNPADSPVIGISHQARAMMQHNPTVSGIQTTPIVATSSAMNSLACSLQPTVSTPLDSNANSLVSALQLQNPVVSNAFHKMPALVAAPSIFTGQQKMMQAPKSATLQSPIMMQNAAQPTSQEIHLRNQLALHNAQISMQQQQQQQHALRLQAQQMQQQQQVTAQIPQPVLGKPFGDLTRDELQQLVLDGIHRVHNGRATNEQVLAILAHPYLTVNGKLIQNPFFEPAQPQPVPNSISLALPQTQMQIPLSQAMQANTITLQPTQQIQLPAGIQGIQQIPIIAQNGVATMQPNMFANALTANGIVQQQQQQPQQTQMQVQSQAAMQVQQQQQKATLMYPQTQQNGQATNANQQHLTNTQIPLGTRLMIGAQQQLATQHQQQPAKSTQQLIAMPGTFQIQQTPQMIAPQTQSQQQLIHMQAQAAVQQQPTASMAHLPTPTASRPTQLPTSLPPSSTSTAPTLLMPSPMLHSQLIASSENRVQSPSEAITVTSPSNKCSGQFHVNGNFKEKKEKYPVVEITEARSCNEVRFQMSSFSKLLILVECGYNSFANSSTYAVPMFCR